MSLITMVLQPYFKEIRFKIKIFGKTVNLFLKND